MTVVIDASVVVAALIGEGPDASWAEETLSRGPLAGPHLLPVESANILRRAALARDIPPELASLAYQDLLRLPVELFPYAPFADRIWDLRGNLTTYDAWYVALAESLGARLATLDARLSRAPGIGCEVVVPR